MSFPVAQWLVDTTALPAKEYTALHRLCCHAWRSAGALPNDPLTLARYCGMTIDDFHDTWRTVGGWFERTGDGRLIAPSIAAEYQRALDLRTARRRGANATNAKRWPPKSLSESQSDAASESLSESDRAPLSVSPSSFSSSTSSDPPTPSPTTGKEEGMQGERETRGERDGEKRAALLKAAALFAIKGLSDVDADKTEAAAMRMFQLTAEEAHEARKIGTAAGGANRTA